MRWNSWCISASRMISTDLPRGSIKPHRGGRSLTDKMFGGAKKYRYFPIPVCGRWRNGFFASAKKSARLALHSTRIDTLPPKHHPIASGTSQDELTKFARTTGHRTRYGFVPYEFGMVAEFLSHISARATRALWSISLNFRLSITRAVFVAADVLAEAAMRAVTVRADPDVRAKVVQCAFLSTLDSQLSTPLSIDLFALN